MKKNRIKKILGIFLLILVSLPIIAFFGNEVRAEINPESNEVLDNIAKGLNSVFTATQALTTGNSLFKSLTGLVGAIAFFIFGIFFVAFSGFTGSIPPTPDAIIFNRVALLDVNFFNPNSYSLISMFSGDKNSGGIIAQLYNSFDTIAISIFVLCAMVVAIKMVLSSVAAEKAAAKNALKYWITGIILLFLMRVIIAGILEFNEIIVYNLSKVETNTSFEISLTEAAGQNMGILDWIGGLFNLETYRRAAIAAVGLGIGNVEAPGYLGMMIYFAVSAWASQNLFSAILFFTIFGQMITLLVTYGKRLMYVLLLGIAAPMVVVVDTLNKITKGSSNLLNSWFKEFTTAVFMQSFHAVMLVIILKMIGAIIEKTNYMLIGIIAIALTTGLVRFEKFYKQLFGLQDGVVGGLKASAGKVMLGLNAAKTGVKAIADNGTKVRNAYKARNEARQAKAEAIRSRGSIYNENAFNNLSLANELITDPIRSQESKELVYKSKEYFDKAKADGYEIPQKLYDRLNKIIDAIERGGTSQSVLTNVNNTSSTISNASSTMSNITTGSQNITTSNTRINSQNQGIRQRDGIDGFDVDNNSNVRGTTNARIANDEEIKTQKEIAKELNQLRREIGMNNRMENNISAKNKEIAKADKQIKEANANLVSAGLATAMGPANLVAGIGIGLGAGSDALSSLNGGYVTAAFDAAAEKAGHAIGKAVNAQFDKHSRVDDTN